MNFFKRLRLAYKLLFRRVDYTADDGLEILSERWEVMYLEFKKNPHKFFGTPAELEALEETVNLLKRAKDLYSSDTEEDLDWAWLWLLVQRNARSWCYYAKYTNGPDWLSMVFKMGKAGSISEAKKIITRRVDHRNRKVTAKED